MGSQLFISKATEVFSTIDTKSMFITIHDYQNNHGEIATHSLCWHINYEKAIEKSCNVLENFIPTVDFCIGKPYTVEDLKLAQSELLKSFYDTLVLGEGNNPRYTNANTYDKVFGADGQIIPGIKIHKENFQLHLTSVYRIAKVVTQIGQYPVTNRNRKTIAKSDLRKLCPVTKWGQFVLDIGRFKNLTVNKITVKERDVINNWHK